jgi:DNA-binding MarR family transcriptional regulator
MIEMNDNEKFRQLRELIRKMERNLGILDEKMTCCGVSLAQCHALVEIGRAGTISLIELANLINLDNSTMSRTVNNLVSNKMAERELDPNDRRYVSIKLTQAGITAFKEIESNMEEYFMNIFDSIPEDKQDQVLDSLQILLKAISENKCCS